ncbi:hypothetical protein EON65_03685 [archaeon]|nr:MAG: hypothetical protein EON65_03685 [archaeon]
MLRIFSGESGAGKTEATKQALNYLAYIAGSSSGIQGKILNASPILEAWGNAKTLRNNNSSRFGKYIEVWFDGSNTIVGSSNTTYILEKSRVVFQSKDERNYHAFYQLLQGATIETLQRYHLQEPGKQGRPDLSVFSYINQSGCITIDDVDDADDFRIMNEAFADVGFRPEDQECLYRTLAGILHLGNVQFAAAGDESVITPETEHYYQFAAEMFGIEVHFFRKALLFKKIKSGGGKRASVAFSPYSPLAAVDNRDALSKEIYRRCFDWIVSEINRVMYQSNSQATLMIGILDIFGFEIFQKNSFEQLCINLANEALQQHFNYNIFQAEMNIYIAEDVPVPQLDFKDNQDVLDLIVKRPKGLIPMLDEEGMIPKGSWEGFFSKFTKQYAGNNRVKVRSKSNELGIVHYAGEVYYDPSLFLIKNKDTLSPDLIEVFSISEQKFLSELFDEVRIEQRESNTSSFRSSVQANTVQSDGRGREGKMPKRSSTVEAKQTVGRKFSLQMESLVTNLNATKPRYIRCIKPNQLKKPNIFIHNLTNEQLTYSGVFEAVIIMQNGYPFRLSHYDFLKTYHSLIVNAQYKELLFDTKLFTSFVYQLNKKELLVDINAFNRFLLEFNAKDGNTKVGKRFVTDISREQCQLMIDLIALSSPNIDSTKFFIGITKVFYRANEHRFLREYRHTRLLHASVLIQKNTRRYIAKKLVKSILNNDHLAILAMKQRNLAQLQTISTSLQDVNLRIERACKIKCPIHIVHIAKDYAEALHKETHATKKIAEIWAVGNMNEEQKYSELSKLIDQAKSVNFSAKHRGITLRLNWKENDFLVDNDEKIRILGLKVKVQKQFADGIQNKNELLLESAMDALKELRQSKVVDSSFCKQFEKDADIIVQSAVQQYDEVLRLFGSLLPQGRCEVKRDDESYHIRVLTNPLPLEQVKTLANTKKTNNSLPLKIQLLAKTCDAVMELRQAAQNAQWEKVQELVKTKWQVNESSDVLDSMNNVVAGKELFLPPTIKADVLAEVKNLNIAAISSHIVPHFNSLLAKTTVPDVPALEKKLLYVDTNELQAAIDHAKAYESYFDGYLLNFIAAMHEHLALRTAICSGSKATIMDAINSIKLMSKTHGDYNNALKCKKMFVAMDKVVAGLTSEQWKGHAGSLNVKDIKCDALSGAVKIATEIEVTGEVWKQTVYVAQLVLKVRTTLHDNKIEMAEQLTLQAHDDAIYTGMLKSCKSTGENAPADICKAIIGVEHEWDVLLKEIRHKKALNEIVDIFVKGCIPFDLEASLTKVSVMEALSDCMHKNKSVVIKTAYSERLLHDCAVVAECREKLYSEDYEALGESLVPIYQHTDHFTQTHEVCQKEYHALLERYNDYTVHKSLVDVLPIAEVPLTNGNACQLLGCIITASEIRKLSVMTNKILQYARAVLMLRCLVRDGHWEPLYIFFGGNIPTDDLPKALQTVEKSHASMKDPKNVDKVLHNLQNVELPASLDVIYNRIVNMDSGTLSVLEVVSWIDGHSDKITVCYDEIVTTIRTSVDRRCRICLLIASGLGKVHGTVDHLNHRLINTDILKKAIQFVEKQVANLSEVTSSWLSVSKFLLYVRETTYECLQKEAMAGSYVSTLHEHLSPQELEDVVAKSQKDFAGDELRLVLQKLLDIIAFDELSKAISFGGPRFESNKFDSSRLEYNHIVERLEDARKLKNRSDRLDRLFFYLELCINLRRAVIANEWELSEAGGAGRRSSTDRTIITVKRCLTEYAQALRFFRTPAPGVPPTVLADEFSLVQREWDRKLLIQGFIRAYNAGTITGNSMGLMFFDVRVDLLEDSLKLIRKMEAESGEVDKTVQMYANAALELIDVRQQAINLQDKFKSSVTFSVTSTKNLSALLGEENFIPDAICRAVSSIQSICSQVDHTASLQSNLERSIKKMKFCFSLPYGLHEAELLLADQFDREFMMQVIPLLRNISNTIENSMKYSIALSDLKKIIIGVNNKQKSPMGEITGPSESLEKRNTKNIVIRRSETFETLYRSTVILIHLYQAKGDERYDRFDREWKIDVNNSNTPQMVNLLKSLDNSQYSIQQLIRASLKMPLHSALGNALRQETDYIEDRISIIEIEKALKDLNCVATGKVGNLVISDECVEYASSVLNRIDELSLLSSPLCTCAPMKDMLHVILQLRVYIRDQEIRKAVMVVRKYLDLPENANVDTILRTLFDSKDRKVMPLAETEFKLLATETCDSFWQIQAKEALLSAGIRGCRGAILAHEVDPSPLHTVLALANSLRLKSKYTICLLELCDEMMKMRELVSGITSKGAGSPIIRSMQRTVSIEAFNSSEIANYVEGIVQKAEMIVDKISSFNWPKDFDDKLVDEIKDQTYHISKLLDSEVLSKNLDSEIRDRVLFECSLVEQHYSFNAVGCALEHVLDAQYIQLTATGLIFPTMFGSLELAVNQGNKESFKPYKLHEYWNAGLHAIAKHLLSLLKFVVSDNKVSRDGIIILPGNFQFDRLMPYVYKVLKAYDDFQYYIDTRIGYRKRNVMPHLLLALVSLLQKACLEHALLKLLCRISKSEMIVLFEDDTGKVRFSTKQIDHIPLLTEHSAVVPTAKMKTDYQTYISNLIIVVNSFRIITKQGQRIQDYVAKLCHFRNHISLQQWANALEVASTIEPVEGYSLYMKDIEFFHIHIHVIQSQRSLEYNLLLSCLPNVLTWSLHSNAYEKIQHTGKYLEEFMRKLVDGSVSSLPKYKIFEELSEISYRLLDVLSSVKKGIWVHASDSADSSNLLQIARHLSDNIYFRYNSDIPTPASTQQDSAFSCIQNLLQILKRCKCIELYIKQLIYNELVRAQKELVVVQFELLSQYTFNQLKFEGTPGELVLDYNHNMNILNILIEYSEVYKEHLNFSFHCKQSVFTAKLLKKLMKANKEGDLTTFQLIADLLLYLDSKPNFSMVLAEVESDQLVVYGKTELMKLGEDEYKALFSKSYMSYTSELEPFEATANNVNIIPLTPEETERLAGNAALQQFIQDSFFFPSVKSVVKYRKEVKSIMSLCKHHVIFELQYSLYASVVSSNTSALGAPGELDFKHLDTSVLANVLTILKAHNMSQLSPLCKLLQDSVDSVFNIRLGQTTEDVQRVVDAIQLGKQLFEIEDSLRCKEISSPLANFGNVIKKGYIALCAQEVKLADEDAKQRHIIFLLEKALRTPGFPPLDASYPFHISEQNMKVQELDQAVSMCGEISPSCTEAVSLHTAADLVLKLRKAVLAKEYIVAIQLVKGVYDADAKDFPSILYNKDEIWAAWRAASISEAILKTLYCFSHGRLEGTLIQITSADSIDKAVTYEALDTFKSVLPEWKDEYLNVLENTIEIVYNIRNLFLNKEYQVLSDLTTFILGNVNNETIKIASECKDEVVLAKKHSAYMLVKIAFQSAFSSMHYITGRFADVKAENLSLLALEEAFELADELKVQHEHIDVLRATGTYVYRLRRAALCNKWHRMYNHLNSSEEEEELFKDMMGEYNQKVVRTGDRPIEDISKSLTDSAGGLVWTGKYLCNYVHRDNEYMEDVLENYEDVISKMYSVDDNAMVDFSESFIGDYELESGHSLLAVEMRSEVELLRIELTYRQVMYKILSGVYSRGYTGTPGSINEENINTQLLEECLEYVQFFPQLAQSVCCAGYIRDCKLLLDARRCRLSNDFTQLNEIVNVAEDHNALVFETRTQRQRMRATLGTMSASDDNEPGVEPVNEKVWEELKLLKYDALFHIVLGEFAQEMRKEEHLSRRASAVMLDISHESVDYNDRIYRIESLLEFTKNASLQYPSAEFDRLIEAIYLGLQLRRFVRDERNKSPQMIIDQVAKIKKRDQKKGVTCYVSLLIFEISKMSNVLDFPILLDKLKYEIIHGQHYLDHSIGLIPYDKIEIRSMVAAYDAAIPSLEIMGTDENQIFMKLAFAVIEIRRALKEGDLSKAMNIAITYEHLLKQSDLVKEEIKRLRVEMENFDAGKLISYGLKTGRYLDVIAIAKMKSLFLEEGKTQGDDAEEIANLSISLTQTSHALLNTSAFPTATNAVNVRHSIYMPATSAKRRRSSTGMHYAAAAAEADRSNAYSRRVSQGIADMMMAFENLYLVDGQPADERDDTISYVSFTDDEPGFTQRRRTSSATGALFIDVVKNSIYALKRAVAVASRVSVKSDSTIYYLNAAKIILELREAIVSNKWDVVQQLVQRKLDLPEVAMEEVNAVREGMFYQKCLEAITEALKVGGITRGEQGVHEVMLEDISFSHIADVIRAIRAGGFQDESVMIVLELAKRTLKIRKSFLSFASTDIVLSNEGNMKRIIIPAVTIEDEDNVLQEEENIDKVMEDFRVFEEKKLRALFHALGLLQNLVNTRSEATRSAANAALLGDNINSMETARSTPPTASAPFSRSRSTLIYKPESELGANADGINLAPSRYYWISDLVDSIVGVKHEIEVISQILQYRNIVCQMIQSLHYSPLPVYRYQKYVSDADENRLPGNLRQYCNEGIFDHLHHLSEQLLSKERQDITLLVSKHNNEDADVLLVKNHYEHIVALATLRGDKFLLSPVQTALDKAIQHKDDFTSKQYIRLMSTLQCILHYRKILDSYSNFDSGANTMSGTASGDLLQSLTDWINRTKTMQAEQKFSPLYGSEEINMYIHTAQQSVHCHMQLIQVVRATRKLRSNLLDFDVQNDLQVDTLQDTISDLKRQIDEGVQGLFVGCHTLFEYSEELLNLRILLQFNVDLKRNSHDNAKVLIEKLVCLRNKCQQANKLSCTIAEDCFLEAEYLVAYVQMVDEVNHLSGYLLFSAPTMLDTQGVNLDKFTKLRALSQSMDIISSFQCADVTKYIELCKLLGSLLSASVQNVERTCMSVVDLLAAYHAHSVIQGEDEIGDTCSILVSVMRLACLWKDLLVCVGEQLWLPQDMSNLVVDLEDYDNKVDPLIKAVFPVQPKESSRVESVTDEEQGMSVLEVLMDLDWSLINHTHDIRNMQHSGHAVLYKFYTNYSVIKFLRILRTQIIEVHLQKEVLYYLDKGAAALDEDGNILLSNVYTRLLASQLQTIDKVQQLADRYQIRLSWSRSMLHACKQGKFVCTCRDLIIKLLAHMSNTNDTASGVSEDNSFYHALVQQLKLAGFLVPLYRQQVRERVVVQVEHSEEVSVLEAFVHGWQGKVLIKKALLYVQSLQHIDNSTLDRHLLPKSYQRALQQRQGMDSVSAEAKAVYSPLSSTVSQSSRNDTKDSHPLQEMYAYLDAAHYLPFQSAFHQDMLLLMRSIQQVILHTRKLNEQAVHKEFGLLRSHLCICDGGDGGFPVPPQAFHVLLKVSFEHMEKLCMAHIHAHLPFFSSLDRMYSDYKHSDGAQIYTHTNDMQQGAETVESLTKQNLQRHTSSNAAPFRSMDSLANVLDEIQKSITHTQTQPVPAPRENKSKLFDAIVEQIIVLLCEIIFFFEEPLLSSVLMRPSSHTSHDLRSRISMRSKHPAIPIETYSKLHYLYAEVVSNTPDFVLYRPHWVIVMVLLTHYMRTEVCSSVGGSRPIFVVLPASVGVSDHLVSFLRDLKVSQYLRSAEETGNRSKQIFRPIATDHGEYPGFYPRNTPNIAILSKHITIAHAACSKISLPKEDVVDNMSVWQVLAEREDARFLDPENITVPPKYWLAYHVGRVLRLAVGVSEVQYDMGLVDRSRKILQSFQLMLTKNQ